MVRVYGKFDFPLLKNINLSRANIDEQVHNIIRDRPVVSDKILKPWLIKAITIIDLTTLSGDDTNSNVLSLCIKAAYPLDPELVEKLSLSKPVTCAAVCVYPSRVNNAHVAIKRMGLVDSINVASVATAFPSGLCALSSRLMEIKYAIEQGATEIDVVIDRSLVLTGQWSLMFEELLQMRAACGDAHLKVILGVGELGSYDNVYKASLLAMHAGADFIKTSTGKETINATLPVGLVMCRAIRRYYQETGRKVGLKPAGGIKTSRDAVNWLVLVHAELGPEWLTPELFRIGASSLLDNVVADLQRIATKPME